MNLWEYYKLVGLVPIKKRQKSEQSKTDLSILMTYTSTDSYLKNKGSLGFVLTRSLFQAELGGWHFRQFSLPSGEAISVESINDFDPLKPFSGQAENVTCVMHLVKEKTTKYPCPWIRWEKLKNKKIAEDSLLEEVIHSTIRKRWIAFPINEKKPQSSWIFGDKKTLGIVHRLLNPSYYRDFAREGINTRGANDIYFVDAALIYNSLIINNRPQDGKNNVPLKNFSIEPDHLYPLLKGREVSRWIATPNHYVILPHSPKSPTKPVHFKALPMKTQDFLECFKSILQRRKKFRNFNPQSNDWHGLYSVLKGTFFPFKVVWREMAKGTVAAVIHTSRLPNGQEKIVIPDHKLFIIPTKNREEAHFICALINSSISSYIVMSYSISTGISTHILDHLPIPQYSSKNLLHKKLSDLSKRCHHAAANGEINTLITHVKDVDIAAAQLWDITDK
ncbi:hypothetical protein KA005_23820, partial [bacterium]|nr:hypothetical protein [bacterium]